jgi:PKD repeat protein
MAAPSLVTNAEFDAALALVPAPWGPATRAAGTDLDTTPINPNSEVRFLVLSASGDEAYITYSETLNLVLAVSIFEQSAGMQLALYNLTQLTEAIDTITTDATAFDALALDDKTAQAFIRLFQAVPFILSAFPLEAWKEMEPIANDPLNADFTASFVDPTVTITAVTGDEQAGAFLWSWGDGSYSSERIPAPHTYVGADTYTVTLLLVGVYGEVSTHTEDFIVT